MSTFYEYLYYYYNALQTPTPNIGFTRRFTACMQRPQSARGALEDPTALPQSIYSAMSNTLCKRHPAVFILGMFAINAAAWRSRRLHSVFTAFLQRCWRLHSAHLGDLYMCILQSIRTTNKSLKSKLLSCL